MTYLGTDPEGSHHFRCPHGGCRLKKQGWTGPRYCNTEHSEKPTGKLLRIMGLVPRSSKLWKKWYKMRTDIERYFSSGKAVPADGTAHRYFRMDKVDLHAKPVHVSLPV